MLDFDTSLSSVTGYRAELSQMWTALIDNALDAMNGSGVLTISAKPEGRPIGKGGRSPEHESDSGDISKNENRSSKMNVSVVKVFLVS